MIKTIWPYGCISEEQIAFITPLTKGRFALVDKAGNQSIIEQKVFNELKNKGFTIKEVKSKI